MGSLTVPESLFDQISKRASAAGRSVDDEAAELLSRALIDDLREAELMTEIRKEREEMAKTGASLTEEFINDAKRWGRQ